jgi:hypothetical protein
MTSAAQFRFHDVTVACCLFFIGLPCHSSLPSKNAISTIACHCLEPLTIVLDMQIKNLLCVATAALQLVSEKANERGGNLRSQAVPPSAEPRAQGLLDNCRKVLLGSLR